MASMLTTEERRSGDSFRVAETFASTMRNQHVWKEKDEEGRKREVRATKFGGAWRLQAKYSDETAGPTTRIRRFSKICGL